MAGQILPSGSYITLSHSSSSVTLYVKSVTHEWDSQPITFNEWVKEKMKSAPEVSGRMPIFGQLLSGDPIQFIYGSGTTSRDLTPDDGNLTSIYQKFFISRYTMEGDMSATSYVNYLDQMAESHKSYMDQFEAFRNYAGANVSITELVNLQSVAYTNITSTGVSITPSASFIPTLSNVFVRSFDADLARNIPNPSLILYRWSAKFELITLESQVTTVSPP